MNPDRPEIVCEYQAIYGRTRILDAYVLYIVFAIKSKTEKNIIKLDKITYKIKKPTKRQ